MTPARTLRGLLACGADEAAALRAPGVPALSYGQLRRHVEQVRETLNHAGIGRNDRVAIVLPNGPEMALAFISVACAATAAPLNPGYRQEEFEFYLSDLKATALLALRGSETPALAAARALRIPTILLEPQPQQGAGSFRLDAGSLPPAPAGSRGGPPEADDIALILHTSGTTSRPKIVPLSQRNVALSAGNVARTLALGTQDTGLVIMPLFHIHGLIAALLAPLSAGGSAYCTPGFNALKFFGWMADAAPTWYTAVSTMHQAVVARSAQNREIIARHPLRFIRSSSSALPTAAIREVEAAFGAPLVEAYGMTEAAHQMTCNPLPPAVRKPGTVGLAAGPEVAVMDAAGQLLPVGEAGEVVIRGSNVTAGYENNPKANEECFTSGWFRTGDLGSLDAEGYLTLTGRLKEIINRGGEKVSPREVDEMLMNHPAVQQVVTFAMPHDKLGEEVAAAVVLRAGQSATDRELRDFVAAHLVDYKVPRRIVIVDEIPKGATGKLQRIGLAQKLGLA